MVSGMRCYKRDVPINDVVINQQYVYILTNFGLISLLVFLSLSFTNGDETLNGHKLVEYAIKQYTKLASVTKSGTQYPESGDPKSHTWHNGNLHGWTAGFYPGVLWHLHNYTNDQKWKHLAIQATDGLFREQYDNHTHDVGFIIMSSYGKGLEFTKNSSYVKVIENAAKALAERFNPIVGCTRSWGNEHSKEFVVIIDNMMNLELLFKASELSGNKTYYNMAVSHADRTMHEHIRANDTTYHVVEYNEKTGAVVRKHTAQGYADWSCWSRGQSWAIAGFTIAYRYTKLNKFLTAAERVSDYYIKNLPEDSIAYVDFNVPHDAKHHYIPRDSSSASIAATGFFELYTYTQNKKYLDTANKIMTSLSSPKYRADGNSAYHLPALIVNASSSWKNGHDMAFSYGEYYYAKAIGHYLH